jgi:hypothetical protein
MYIRKLSDEMLFRWQVLLKRSDVVPDRSVARKNVFAHLCSGPWPPSQFRYRLSVCRLDLSRIHNDLRGHDFVIGDSASA